MEKPMVIFSSWLSSGYEIAKQKNIAVYSNYLAQKAGYKTVLYTDEKSKKILEHIPYDEIVNFDEQLLEKLPNTVWSAAKLLAMSMQKGPFMHLDLDLFLLENKFFENIKYKDFFVFHKEPWRHEPEKNFNTNGVQKILNITDNIFDIDLDSNSISLNFAIFGTCNPEIALTISEEARILVSKLIQKKQELENPALINYLNNEFDHLATTVLSIIIEQIIFPYTLIKKYKYVYYPILDATKIDDIIKEFKKVRILHLWSGKNYIQVQNKIEQVINKILN